MIKEDLPKHVAIIMDGNGRWAEQRRLLRTQGHLEGVKRVEEITTAAREAGIRVLTLFAFSTENWKRPKEEVSMLMRTFINVLNQKIKTLHRSGIQFRFIGRRQGVPQEVCEAMDSAIELTKNNTGMIINLALNYGGRTEIVDAVRKIARDAFDKHIVIDDIDENMIGTSLYTAGLPDPDLLIRTSGEQRISNFLLWQLSYAEFYFTEKFWPDFTKEELHKALENFKNRKRRYGKIAPVKG